MAQVSLIELGQVGDYEIRLLKVFKTVVECGGFSAAETVLNISRSTISVHMANLEQRLKLKLCNRGRAGSALTMRGPSSMNQPAASSPRSKIFAPRSMRCMCRSPVSSNW